VRSRLLPRGCQPSLTCHACHAQDVVYQHCVACRRDFGTAKKRVLWHSRRGLERYYANISLMCDNCREYQRNVDDPSEVGRGPCDGHSYSCRKLLHLQLDMPSVSTPALLGR
jgi:hypothetical protein